jgi:hypothetical protein
MTFPAEPRTLLFELQVGATDWANITPYVFSNRQQVDITWGMPGEYSQTSPSECGFEINNLNGLFSPRNPNSVLWDKIGRNTPIRVSIGEGAYGMVLGLPDATESNGRAESVDSAQLSPTGDLDLRVDMEILPGSTRLWSTGDFDVCSKFADNDADRSYSLIVVGGKPRLNWFTAGTAASVKTATGAVALPGTTGRLTLRATLDVDNGAGQSVVTFYTSTTGVNGSWTVLGSPVNVAGASSVFNGGAPTRIGATGITSSWSWGYAPHCTIYEAQLRSSIGGTVIASPNFTTQPLDPVPFAASNFSDAQGNNWTYNGSADAARVWYGDVDIRAWQECSSFPNRWDTSGNDAWVPIGAAGLLRRLGYGQEPASTGLRDWIMSRSPVPTSYFPLSGAEGTQYSLNLGDIGTNSLKFYPEAQGTIKPVYTYGKDFGTPYLGNAMELNATGDTADMRGDVVTSDDNFAFDFVFWSPFNTVPGTNDNTNIGVLDIVVWSYDYDRWKLRLQDPANGGTLQVTWYDGTGGSTAFPVTAAIPALLDNEIHTCRFEAHSTGGGTTQTYVVYIDGVQVDTGVQATGRDINGVWLYQLFYSRYTGQTVVNLGHLTLWSQPTWPNAPAVGDFHDAAMGYAGELAADRMVRIAGLGGIPLTIAGSNADTMPMGPQYSESKLSQLRDAEQADMGFLTEPRDRFGLVYRTRVSLINQTPALTLSYADGHLVRPFEPTDDDLLTKNDMTATRREGDSYRAQLLTGRLSVLDPPAGVGRYHDQAEFNVVTDALLSGIAAWLVNKGTVDQARYPSVTVDLGILAGVGLDAAARAIKVGDLLVIEELSELGVFDDVRLLVLGGHETISDGAYRHLITWNCAPYLGYEGSVYATSTSSGIARYDTGGSQIDTAIGTLSPSLSVIPTPNAGGTLWTTDAAAYPLDIMVGGERMTVTSAPGGTSPQTLPVTRSVNGVVKAHAVGADVRLADPAYYSL